MRVLWCDTGWSDFTFVLVEVNARIARNVLQRDWTLVDIRTWRREKGRHEGKDKNKTHRSENSHFHMHTVSLRSRPEENADVLVRVRSRT